MALHRDAVPGDQPRLDQTTLVAIQENKPSTTPMAAQIPGAESATPPTGCLGHHANQPLCTGV